MPMVITIKGLDLTKEHLARFKASMADMTDTMAEVGDVLAKYYSGEAFVSQGQVYGDSWAPLAPSTVAEKSKKWPGRPPEVRSGLMQNSFGTTVTPVSVTVINKQKYFEYQQLGTSRGIPPRLIMALNDALKTGIVGKVREAVMKKIEETRG